MINVAVIGYGYWGPRVARNFYAAEQTNLYMICDSRPELLRKASSEFPGITVTTDIKEVMASTKVGRCRYRDAGVDSL